jgi:RNA polymerase sigma-70 factor (ECF subfamily)
VYRLYWQPPDATPPMHAGRSHQDTGWTDCLPVGADGTSANAPWPDYALPDRDQQNAALEVFFIETEETAFHVAYAALWEREAALDAVQESMTRLVEYYRDKPAAHWPALFRTILNSKINDIRRRRLVEQGKHRLVSLTGMFRHSRDDESAMDEYELPSYSRDDGVTAPEVGVITKQLRDRIADALQNLSERQRQVFILREWRGMSISETAKTLGCSENSVKQHHFRAMRELRIQLAEVWSHAQPTSS